MYSPAPARRRRNWPGSAKPAGRQGENRTQTAAHVISNAISMYQPDHFRIDDLPPMHALMRARPFAAFISAGPAGLFAAHLPTVLNSHYPCAVIQCHLSRANPHWKDLPPTSEALLIF